MQLNRKLLDLVFPQPKIHFYQSSHSPAKVITAKNISSVISESYAFKLFFPQILGSEFVKCECIFNFLIGLYLSSPYSSNTKHVSF